MPKRLGSLVAFANTKTISWRFPQQRFLVGPKVENEIIICSIEVKPNEEYAPFKVIAQWQSHQHSGSVDRLRVIGGFSLTQNTAVD